MVIGLPGIDYHSVGVGSGTGSMAAEPVPEPVQARVTAQPPEN